MFSGIASEMNRRRYARARDETAMQRIRHNYLASVLYRYKDVGGTLVSADFREDGVCVITIECKTSIPRVRRGGLT